jgi:MtaA/CmuA family methyltransferase
MNGYQRVAAALRGEWPDTTPVMLHNFMLAAHEAGVSMAQFRSDPEALARSFIRAIETYRYDGIMIDVDTVTLAGASGVPIDYPDDEPARIKGHRIASLEEVAELPPVDILDFQGVQVWLEGVRILKRHFGDEIYIRGNCDQCPYTLAGMIRGIDDWMMDMMDPEAEESAIRLLDYCLDITLQFIQHMSTTGAHMTSNGDSVAGPELVSPEIYRRFAAPYDRKAAKYSHRLGFPYILHICGKTEPILREMVATGADGLELDYKTDPKVAHDILKDTTTFVGNIDPSGVLALGTPTLVREKTLELLRIFSDTPRFILNAGCAIPKETPSENLRILIQTAREFQRQ